MYNTRAGESLQRDEEPCQLRAGSSGEKSSAAASEISGVCLSCSNTRKRESNDGPGSGIPTKNRPAHNTWTGYTQLLEEGCDGALFVGMHAMAGTPDGVLCHTVSSEAWHNLWFNDTLVGETGINAALCGTWGAAMRGTELARIGASTTPSATRF